MMPVLPWPERVAGSETAFAKMMTEKARQLGATRTICKTASGLTAKGQQTTARDLAVIFKHAMQHNEFATRIKRTKVKTSYANTEKSQQGIMANIRGRRRQNGIHLGSPANLCWQLQTQ